MQKTILLISPDETLQSTHASILERAGYQTACTSDLSQSAVIAARSHMAIIGHTYTVAEQDEFIDRVHETNPSVYILCLRFGLILPKVLVKACNDCFCSQPGGSRVSILEQINLISWPKRA